MIDSRRRKELKSQFTQARQQAGVYRITNTAIGRALISSTVNLASAKNRFEFAVTHKSTGALDQRLKRDVLSHGFGALTFDVLETIEPGIDMGSDELATELKTLEQLWREQLAGSDLY